MAPSAGCSLQETCKDERLTSWQSLRLKAVVLMLVCLPVAAARLPAVKPGLAGEGYYSKAKAGGNGRVVGARNYIETAEMMAHGTPVMSATICRGSSSALKGVLGQPTADKGTDVEHNPSPHQAAVGSRASPSQQPTIPAAQFTLCPAKTSDRHTQTGGGVSQQHNKPADLSYELPELVEGRSLIDLPWGEEVLVGSDHDAGKVASASFSFFEWSRRKLLNRQMELQRLHTDSETRMLDEVDISPILRLTHRAKTERQLPDSPAHNPSPPGPGSPFSSLDHEHLLAADAARRALISSSKIALGGSTVPLGYYFAEIALGTPPQRFQMIVDTGSAIMYVPAKECVSCGGTHESLPYDHEASSTYSPLLCSAATCTGSTLATCPTPDSPCQYQQHYSEGSSTSGTVAIDVLSLPGVLGASKIMFGCETRETGLLYTQTADGIIGLGRGPGSIIAQLAQQRAVDDAFSLCFGGVEGGGAMVFGSVGVLPGTVWVPMLPQTSTESMYFADVYGLQVGGSAVSLDAASVPVTAMIDSGTTYTYLPSALYGPLVARLLQAIPLPLVPVPKRSLSAACWGKVTGVTGLSSAFPTMGFVFANRIAVEIPPDNYVFKHPSLAGAYCLGIFSSGQHGATIGGISVHNLLVTYDRAHQLFGFARLNCSAVADGSLTLPKPQTSFPNLSAPNKTRYANTSAPTYARIPFRTANIPAMNASSLTSARARDPVPNPWAATLEGLLYDEPESPSPAPVPAEAVPGSGMGKSAPETAPPGTAEVAGTSAQGAETATGASSGYERPSALVISLCAVVIALLSLFACA